MCETAINMEQRSFIIKILFGSQILIFNTGG